MAARISDSRAVTQLLALMDGLKRVEGVIVIGTTNRIEAIDPAFRRPGRFDREIFFPTPTAEARREILASHPRDAAHGRGAAVLAGVAQRAHGFVGADLMELAARRA